MDTFFTNANTIIDAAYRDWDRNNYILAYFRCIPARILYLADAITSIAKAALSTFKLLFYSTKSLIFCKCDLEILSTKQELGKNLSRILLSTIGAWGITSFPYYFQNTNFFEDKNLFGKFAHYIYSFVTCKRPYMSN